ncbi:MAG: circadian clock protein KaiC [Verrucomicrobia bacterium]|nr:circadian clock protein KaiC [Verrucomicrobiota bacterium]
MQPKSRTSLALAKCPTGIRGLDEITEGGLPQGRPTLICGAASCGKTLLAMEFIVRGAREFNEPGVFMAFEETGKELADNVASLGFDLPALIRQKKVAVDHVRVERSEIEETGEFDLEGLFVRLGSAIGGIGAKRVVLDSLEALFAGLPNEAIVRAELRRLFGWLKQKGVTAIITGEQGEKTLTRHGLEEYVSDCVIFLDHRVSGQVATRRVRIVKYRGSAHGTNEYPALIDEQGLSVLPISSLGLTYPVSAAHVSSGIPRLDVMLAGKGYWKGSSILVSGTAGSGKSSIGAVFTNSVCSRGGRCLYWSSEESPDQIMRNMSSIGIDLRRHVRKGLLRFYSIRPTICGLESHLVALHKMVTEFRPEALVMDPITNLTAVGNDAEIKAMLTRVIDFLKNQNITAIFTSLTAGGAALEQSEVGVSSLMDTWLLLSMVQSASERNRVLYLLKSRGMAHSNQMREFVLSDKGIDLVDVYVGPGAVFTGAARLNQEAHDQAEAMTQHQATERRQRELNEESRNLQAQVAALQTKLANIAAEQRVAAKLEKQRADAARRTEAQLARARKAD